MSKSMMKTRAKGEGSGYKTLPPAARRHPSPSHVPWRGPLMRRGGGEVIVRENTSSTQDPTLMWSNYAEWAIVI
jgi:hypothetical protein